MPRHPDSGRFDLAEAFARVQDQMLAQLATARLLEHASAAGNAAEHIWLEMFDQYLPKRYRAAPAFIINAHGDRSRQIDIAIFDQFNGSPLFPHPAGLHIPIESVYAVFEVKPTISKQWLRDAGDKAASVRALHQRVVPEFRTQHQRLNPRSCKPILAGLLAATSVWSPLTYDRNVRRALQTQSPVRPAYNNRIDLGCALQQGAFEQAPFENFPFRRANQIKISNPSDSLAFLILHLLERLRNISTNSTPNLRHYRSNLGARLDPAA